MIFRSYFQRFSIRQKLVGILLTTSLTVLAVTCGALLILEILNSRTATVRDLSAIADIVAENSAAAVIFDDEKLAQEIISGLRVEPQILRAALFNPQGKILGVYRRGVSPPTPFPQAEGVVLHFNDFSLVVPVRNGDRQVGALSIQGTFQDTYQRLGVYAVVLLGIMGSSVVVALFLSAFFQRVISVPLLNLAQTARLVSSQQNYSVRAEKTGDDELGALTDAFNRMLERIELAHSALRESEERFRTLADNMAQLAWMADELGSAIWYNQRWYDYTGSTVEEMKGRGWENLHHPDHLERVKRHLQECFQAETTWEDTFPLRGRDGNYRWFLSRAIPIRSSEGRVVRWFGTNTDVTNQRLVEEALTVARDEAVRAARTKDDFLAALSHELRTPLSPVLLLASDAARNPDFPPAAREHFEMIRKNVALEARLIDDLLDLTSITRSKLILNRQLVRLHDIVSDALETVKPDLEEKHLELKLALHPGQPCILGDSVRIQQVLWNLLKNAVKFTPPHGCVTVTTRIHSNPAEVEIEVADTGLGLTAGEISKVFTAFSQGDHAATNSAHRFGGLGLGLAISRSIVELHSGRISVESPGRDQGAKFSIYLPLAAVEMPAAHRPVASHANGVSPTPFPPSRRIRILLVEDHAPTRNTLSLLLQNRAFEVRAAASLAEARRAAATDSFEVLISDIGLPDGSGYDLMRELSSRQPVAGIALTGYGTEENVEQTLAAGFQVHLTKPVHVGALEEAIAKVLATLKP